MELRLSFGGVGFRILSEVPLTPNPRLAPFIDPSAQTDCTVLVVPSSVRPEPGLGSRLLLSENGRSIFQLPDGGLYCLTAPAGCRWGVACSSPDLRSVEVTLCSDVLFFSPLDLLHYFPIQEILQEFGVLFLHAAQIAVAGRGVLFTAPSGTGKTTQSNLWAHFKNARCICNDRTLLRRFNGGWRTFGFPLDGSAPIGSGEILPLAAIVALQQSHVNEIERFHAARAASFLMQQLVLGRTQCSKSSALDMLLRLIEEDVPVYFLRCTADERAVTCLERRLIQDGVLPDG